MSTFEEIKKHEELKKLCVYSYKKGGKLPDGYVELFPKTGDNGFFATVVKKGNNIIIVYRGTELDDKNDLKDDVNMLINKLPTQYKDAINLYDEVSKYCKNNGYKLSVTGHSLGGSLAAIVSAMRGVDAVTFNPYGVKNLLDPNIKYITNKVINYCCDEDIITRINAENHIGKCYSISSSDYKTNPHLLENMDSLDNRKEAYGPYLQDQYEREERSKKEFEEYKKNGRRIMRMPGLYSGENQSGCTGSYPVSGYTRDDGTKVDGYIRTCYKHGY